MLIDRWCGQRRWTRASTLLLGVLALGACDSLGGVLDPDDDFDPELVDAQAIWIDQGWSRRAPFGPLGQAAVELTWELPSQWDGEPFRVYSRRSDRNSWLLVATVTSCGESLCRYTDLNVVAGRSYDYYIATLDERNEHELGRSEAWKVVVPAYQEPAAPRQPTAVALDRGVFLRWPSTGASRYRIFVERVGTDSVFYEIGSSDGAAFLDTRAQNGTRYGYRVAAVDTLGRVSARSPLVLAVPRPDYHSEVIYPLADSAAASGFRFVAADSVNPVLAGTSAQAQWRLESSGAELRIVPLGATRVTQGTFTTALTCGPQSDSDCEALDRAPPASAFGTAPVPISAGNSYVFQVTAADGRTHYGKIRVQGRAPTASGRTAVVFDWAYQLIAGETSLRVARD